MNTEQALPPLPSCRYGNVLDCGAKLLGKGAEQVAGNAFEVMVKELVESSILALQKLSTFWLAVPDPDVTEGDVNAGNVGSVELIGPLEHMTDNLAPYLLAVTLAAILIHCVMVVLKMSGAPLLAIGRTLLTIVLVQGTLGAFVQLSLGVSDAASRQFLDLPGLSEKGFESLINLKEALGPAGAQGLWLIMGILNIFGALMQLVFMLFRSPFILLLMLAIHAAAAVSGGEQGQRRLARASGLMFSFIIYKPVAALIYAFGFMLIYGVDGEQGWKGQDNTLNAVYGFTIVLLASLALPAVIKFVDSGAGATGSALFSGGALAAGVAAGAVAIGSMGAGAAGGAAGAGSAGSRANMAGGGPNGAGPNGGGPNGGGPNGAGPNGGGPNGAGPNGGGSTENAGPSGAGTGGTGNGVPGDASGASGDGGGEPSNPGGSEGGVPGSAPDDPAPRGGSPEGGPGKTDSSHRGRTEAADGATSTPGRGKGEPSGGSDAGKHAGASPEGRAAEGAAPTSQAGASQGAGGVRLPAWAGKAHKTVQAASRANAAVEDAITAEGAVR